jgi:hypothetical protein
MIAALERIRTTCTFCRFGCELEIVRRGRSITGVEYPGDSPVSGGRLCARGSASALLLDHPMRLGYPLKDGRERTWPGFFAEAGPIIRDCPSNELAVTYDRNLTQEELELVWGFAGKMGTEKLASADLEAEAHFQAGAGPLRRLDEKRKGELAHRAGLRASLDDIARAETILVVGDVFGVMPVIAKPILDARYADRSRRLFYLDSVKSRVAGFAHRFLWVRPGTEPLVLLALAGLADRKLSGFDPDAVADCAGVKAGDLREVASAFAKPKRGLVVATMQSGRVTDPKFMAAALELLVLRLKGAKKLLFASETGIPAGKIGFGKVLAGIEQGEIKVLVNFGERFPFDYPMLGNRLQGLKLMITTATLRPRAAIPGWVLPVPLNLEKGGTVGTLWGTASLVPAAEPVSGSRPIERIIEGITGSAAVRAEIPERTALPGRATKAITDQGRAMLKKHCGVRGGGLAHPAECGTTESEKPGFPFVVLAEKPAYDFLGIFAKEAGRVTIHPQDAAEQGVGDGSPLKIETASGRQAELKTRISEKGASLHQVKPGLLLVNANDRLARALFELEIDPESGIATIAPVRGRIL